MTGNDDDEPPDMTDEELSDELAAYYREVLLTHGSVYGASNCSICGVARCPDWVDAYDKLAVAGKLMGEPQQWEPLLRNPRRYQ
jgi:hypothetical protein